MDLTFGCLAYIESGEDEWGERREASALVLSKKEEERISSEIGQSNSESAPDRPWNLR